jgi:hypothetical protein
MMTDALNSTIPYNFTDIFTEININMTEISTMPYNWTDATMPYNWTDATVPFNWTDATMPYNWTNATMPYNWTQTTMPYNWTEATIPFNWTDATISYNWTWTTLPPVIPINWTAISNYTSETPMNVSTMITTEILINTTMTTTFINTTTQPRDTIDVDFFTSMRMSLPFIADYNNPTSDNYTELVATIRVYVRK